MRQASMRFINFSVSVPVWPAAERNRGVLPASPMPAAFILDTATPVGLRDRALIGVMTYAFARVGAVVSMRVEDYFERQALVGAAARERRQAARDAGASQDRRR
jgi:hypothetical protein